jgi:hypothetical protein
MLAQGADVNAKGPEGQTALMLATFEGHLDIVQALLARSANVNAKDHVGTTALMLAASRGHTAIVQALLAQGASIDAKNNYGWTALMMATVEGRAPIVQSLLGRGADMQAKNNEGKTALMLAEARGLSNIFQQKIPEPGQEAAPGRSQALAEQTGRDAEQKTQELEQARLLAGQKAHEAELKARELEQARLLAGQKASEAEQKARELEQARLLAEQKARELEQTQGQTSLQVSAEQKAREIEQKARELEQAHLLAEQKARETEQKTRELEQARLLAEQKGHEQEQARLQAEQKARELEQARLLAEQRARDAEQKAQEQERARLVAERKVQEIERSSSQDTSPVELPGGISLGRFHALVIGNDAYSSLPRLLTAVHDANSVAETLRDAYGFNVTLLLDATREQIILAFDKLRGMLTERDDLLIYYAGHGYLDTAAERGYWLPVDAHADTRVHWLSTTEITDTLKAMTARHVMVISDSCYAGTLVRNGNANLKTGAERNAYLARIVQKRARMALTSGGLEPVLDGGGGKHSVFAKALLAVLQENRGVLDGQQLFLNIRRLVVVNSPQTPEYSVIRETGHDGGDFLFVRKQ